MPAGRPKSEIDTTVVAVRIPTELKDRLGRHVDLATSRGMGMKASINSVVGYAIKSFLDAQDREREPEHTRQEVQRPSTPDVEISTQPRKKPFRFFSPERRKIITLLQDHPEGLSPAGTKKLLGGEKDLGSTMKSMARDGLLRRVSQGIYKVAEDVESLSKEK